MIPATATPSTAPRGLAHLLAKAPRQEQMKPGDLAEACLRAQDGDEVALERAVRAHLRLVARLARRYRRKGVSLDDLVNEGNIGLVRAIRKFDPEFGMPFVPYAMWWIKQAMIMFLIQHGQGAISLPIRKVQMLKRLRREEDQLKIQLGRAPTEAELAERVNLAPEKIQNLRRHLPEYVAWEDFREEPKEDREAPHPAESRVDNRRLRGVLEEMVEDLPDRDRQGVRLYFGLDGGVGMNYADLGRSLEMTREGARQMIKRSLRRLRENPRARPLQHWL